MPADHITLGRRGETLAAEYLADVGGEILARNYRWGRAEVDIILRGPRRLHFVEVKTRRWNDAAAAALAVTPKQQALILAAAGRYMQDTGYGGEFQFDIVTVIIPSEARQRITWAQDAFGFTN